MTSLLAWALAAWLLPRGLPIGIIGLGASFGALYGLVAVGVVLVYRASKIVNFAQAELGSIAGVIAIHLALQRDWNYFLALAIALLLGAGTGALVEVAVMRRFRKAPRLIATVATIGLAQVLNGVGILVALLVSDGLASGNFSTPFSFEFTVDPVVFTGDHLLAGATVITLLALLGAALRRTDYGLAVRAAADSGDRARLLGIPVDRLSTLVWTLAGLVSAIGIVLRIPLTGFQSFSGVSGGGTSLLLRALAAAVIARMDRFGTAAAAGVALGVVEAGAAWSWGNTAYADGVLVVVILAALLLQRGDFSRVAEGLQATSTFQAIREVRPVPSELIGLPEVRWGSAVMRVGVVLFAVSVPLWATPSRVQLAALVLIYALVALSLVVLTGWAGHISLGHWALVGLGGTATVTLHSRYELDLFIAALGGIAVSSALAVVIGIPAMRVRGPFLAVTTLAFAVTTATLLLNIRYVPWWTGDRVDRPDLFGRLPLEEQWQTYYLALVVLVLAIAGLQALRRSRTGRALVALRDNRANAESVGASPRVLQLQAFAISGALAGVAGVLYAIHQGGIRQDAFDATVGLRIFSMVVIGGLGSLGGAVLGALYVRGAEFFLSPGWALLASGGGILFLLLLAPGGIGELLYRLRDRLLRTLAARRGIVVPSLLADERTDENEPDPDHRQAASTSGHDPLPDTDVLLEVRGLDVAYDDVQVLFRVDLEVHEREILALLGTNGAGKSTVLRAVSGLVAPSSGTVRLDGHDLSGATTTEAVEAGIFTLPGGRGVFPTLTVAEHFRVGAWSQRHDPEHIERATQRALDAFPVLGERWDEAAGNLSGGQQQMLNLSLTLLVRPRLLLIDELSLGLAPAIVDELITIVREIHAAGTAIVIVEQSVHTALRLAQRAVFMEKGEVRYTGPTAELLERPDLLRAVFLDRAAPATVARTPDQVDVRRTPLQLRGLAKRFGGIVATDHVDLDLRGGEILGLIGPNGAGKTTLFDLISGFTTPDEGSIHLHGTDITSMPADRRARVGLGRVFQDARLWPSLTVAEAIGVARERHVAVPDPLPALFGLPIVAESEAEVSRRVAELIELLGLGAFRDKFVSELSTGSRRIVELACVLAHEPSVLLLDEPSSGVAQRETEALGPVLRDLQSTLGCSIVVIDHDLPLVLGLVDRLVALHQGAVLAAGAPDDVIADPEVMSAYLGQREETGEEAGGDARSEVTR